MNGIEGKEDTSLALFNMGSNINLVLFGLQLTSPALATNSSLIDL